MVPPETRRPFVTILLGKDPDAEILQYTIDVLEELQIPHETVSLQGREDDPDLSAYLADAVNRGLGVIIVGTYFSYTDELFPTVAKTLLPTVKVITGPEPAPEQVSLNIALMGFGAEGAKNAGLFAARVLALNDPSLAARLRARPS